MINIDELKAEAPKEIETLRAMSRIANSTVPCLPTDGAKITPSMLDSKADLQALIDGAEMFRVVKTIEPININACPGFSLTHGYLA
jgi:hypothetical protein|tara:strand:+ start:1191 stop:1448 length:258 start_codon:yes stop_codon:yes gene_type:complete